MIRWNFAVTWTLLINSVVQRIQFGRIQYCTHTYSNLPFPWRLTLPEDWFDTVLHSSGKFAITIKSSTILYSKTAYYTSNPIFWNSQLYRTTCFHTRNWPLRTTIFVTYASRQSLKYKTAVLISPRQYLVRYNWPCHQKCELQSTMSCYQKNPLRPPRYPLHFLFPHFLHRAGEIEMGGEWGWYCIVIHDLVTLYEGR